MGANPETRSIPQHIDGHTASASRENLELQCQLPHGLAAMQRSFIDGVPAVEYRGAQPENPEAKVARSFAILGIDPNEFGKWNSNRQVNRLESAFITQQTLSKAGSVTAPDDISLSSARKVLMERFGLTSFGISSAMPRITNPLRFPAGREL